MAAASKNPPLMVTILGPTATGKTRLAACLAARLDAEVISADSRQVYRGMDIGTGKDLEDYRVDGKLVPSHLVDIAAPGYEYNVFEYQRDFLSAFKDICSRGKMAVLCGGSGMYLEAVLSGYHLLKVPENPELRKVLETKSDDELRIILKSLRPQHNKTDLAERSRTIRAIEIVDYEQKHPEEKKPFPEITHRVFGLHFEREEIRRRITQRLKARLDEGMADEVKALLASGLSPQQLSFYGLEYRYLTDFMTGKYSYDEMFRLLNTAIHQFAKRQMTWFRRMEKKGTVIDWIDGHQTMTEKITYIESRLA